MEDFKAEWDAMTLAEAGAITGDPARFQAARMKAEELIAEKRRETAALERVREPQPMPDGATLGSSFSALLNSNP